MHHLPYPCWVVILVLGLWAASHAHAHKDYKWNTGSWGVCWSERGCGLGSEERNVWCGDAHGRPLPPTLCKQQDRPPNSRSCYTSCSDGSWLVDSWSPCQVQEDRTRDSEGRCHGRRTRTITCEVDGSPSTSDQCSGPQPSTEIACTTTCPQDCVLGPWGSWGPCVSCDSSQKRTRTVLVAPTAGGTPCQPLSESKPCIMECLPSAVSSALSSHNAEPLARLRVGEWSPCQIPLMPETIPEDTEDRYFEENSIFFDGDNKGNTGATLLEAVDEEVPRASNSVEAQLPSKSEKSWSNAQEPSHSKSERPWRDDSHEDPQSKSEIPWRDYSQEDPQSKSEGPWRDAREDPLSKSVRAWRETREVFEGDKSPKMRDDALPKVGRQERQLTCVHWNGTSLPLSECLSGREDVAERVRTCVVDRDCVVTQWSSWTTVVPGCVAPSGLVVREIRERQRSSSALQHGGGVPCPHLLEKHTLPDPALQPCDTRYQWVSSAWDTCVAPQGEREGAVLCGGGVQTRQLTCVRAADHVPVSDDLCVHVQPPPRVQRCEVGCERDCVVGPWSAWGVCTPTDCTASPPPATPGFRRRRRQEVVSASAGGVECPPLEEQSECHEAQCHQWVLGSWSQCQLTNPSHSCGDGRQTRNTTCLDSAGAPAPWEECQQELGTAPEQRECHVPCSFDCVVGQWSPWSPCTRPCASQLHVGFTQRNTTIIAPPGPGGTPCPPPDELTQVETCRVEPCGGAAWVAAPWGRCGLPARAACGPGRQSRTLHCRDHKNNTVSTYRCSGLSRPSLERPCEVPCGTACTVTSWSEWSPCLAPDPCPVDGVLVSSTQRRWRRVLVEASEGGAPCPHLEEERGCAQALVTCKSHYWRVGPWAPCTLADDVECGTGYRVRRVECVNAAGEVTEPTQCLLGEHIVPESSVECQVSCREACVTSTWTAWSACPRHPPCGTASLRTRQLLDGSQDNPGCQGMELRQSEECPCHNFYSTPASSWSSCLVEGAAEGSTRSRARLGTARGSVPPGEAGLCGVGVRYRALLCTRDDGVLAHPRSCGHSGVEEEPCMVECPSECRVGPWGAWSACNASCGAGLQHRTREIQEQSLWGGRPCPETSQSRACWGSCSAHWVPGGWSECHIINNKDCGTGLQTRTIRCMMEASTGLQEAVSDSECDVSLRPFTQQDCHVSCPGECVLSTWSPWSSCPQGCPAHSRQTRSRQVVRKPVGNLATCPPLRQEEPCVEGASCWHYSWQVGNWTSCVPLGHSSCGEGVRNRPITCVRSGGVAVPEWMCPRESRPSPKETWCYVDCPIDCEVTTWTTWDDSKCSCGENPGEMTRRRFLSVNPSESGRPCPSQLQQSRPCPAIPCYTWERGPWSQCQLQGGSCGHGYVERKVSCVGPWGQTVDPHLCLALVHVGGHTWPYLARALDLNTRDGCYVPCEGDCELTEWASWSHCHRDCSRGHQGGTQARSRAVLTEGVSEGHRSCPGPLWETRPCLAGPCFSFSWQVHNGTVQCVRSDGLLTTGGCEGEPRPCVPECSVRGSLCSAVGTCVCRPGLRPLYSEKQRFRLTNCVPVRNLSFPLPQPLFGAKYLPEDINVWMFAMVGVGSAFVIFVVISMCLLCQSPREHTTTPLTLRRQKNLRHRPV